MNRRADPPRADLLLRPVGLLQRQISSDGDYGAELLAGALEPFQICLGQIHRRDFPSANLFVELFDRREKQRLVKHGPLSKPGR